eukprot:1351030-Pleurochrysis_carterae.AAC.4
MLLRRELGEVLAAAVRPSARCLIDEPAEEVHAQIGLLHPVVGHGALEPAEKERWRRLRLDKAAKSRK